jgi:hypothetical protein
LSFASRSLRSSVVLSILAVGCATAVDEDFPGAPRPDGGVILPDATLDAPVDDVVNPPDATVDTAPDAALDAPADARPDVAAETAADADAATDTANPAPTVTAVTPSAVVEGAAATAITVTGTNFVNGARITAAGVAQTTTFTSATELRATLAATLLASPRTIAIGVTNPTPGGGPSATTVPFTVDPKSNPAPTVTAVSPNSVAAGAGGLPVTITGTGFVSTSSVTFGGTGLTGATIRSATEIAVTIPAARFATAGSFPIVVTNPAPGGGASSPVNFTVSAATAATVASLAPAKVSAPVVAPIALTLTGSGFKEGSVVRLDATDLTGAVVTGDSKIEVSIPAARLPAAATHAITVRSPGGEITAPHAFAVENPAPVLNAISPSGIIRGAPNTTITLTGTGFVPSSKVVLVSGVPGTPIDLATTYGSTTSLTATLLASHLASETSLGLKVTSGAPGGGDSAVRNVAVTTCDTSGVDWTFAAAGDEKTVALTFTEKVSSVPFVNEACPATQLSLSGTTGQRGYVAYVVQNVGSAPLDLSAWAVCEQTGDRALMTFYPKTKTPPANKSLCYTQSSSGGKGYVAGGNTGNSPFHSSPESGGSVHCPGLLKSRDAALRLAACETAVVWINLWHSSSGNEPERLKLRVDAP